MMFPWRYRGATIADYMSLFEDCLDLPRDQAQGFSSEVQTHLEDRARRIRKAGVISHGDDEARRKKAGPRRLGGCQQPPLGQTALVKLSVWFGAVPRS
jgi:hypothetical protein